MTECTRQPLLFSSLGSQKIVADFDGGRLTSDAGGLLLRECDRQLGLTAALADCPGVKQWSPKCHGWEGTGHYPKHLTFYLDEYGSKVDNHAPMSALLAIVVELRKTFPNLVILDPQAWCFYDDVSFREHMERAYPNGDPLDC